MTGVDLLCAMGLGAMIALGLVCLGVSVGHWFRDREADRVDAERTARLNVMDQMLANPDARAIAQDWQAVGDDLRSVLPTGLRASSVPTENASQPKV